MLHVQSFTGAAVTVQTASWTSSLGCVIAAPKPTSPVIKNAKVKSTGKFLKRQLNSDAYTLIKTATSGFVLTFRSVAATCWAGTGAGAAG